MVHYRGALAAVTALAVVLASGFTVNTVLAQDDEEEPVSPGSRQVVISDPAVRDDGEHGDLVTLEDGSRAQMVGGRLLLQKRDRKVIAPDGDYRLADGRVLTVAGGKLQAIGDDAQSGRPELPAVQSGRPKLPAVQSGRPETPGSRVKVNDQDYDREGGMQSGRPELPAVQSGRPEMPGSRVKVNDHDYEREGGMQSGRPELPAVQSGRPETPGSGVKVDDMDWDREGGMQSGRPEMPGQAGRIKLPAVQSGRPEMPGSRVKVNDHDWDLTDGRRLVTEQGPGGKVQVFLVQGSSKVLAPDGQYQVQGGGRVTVQGGSIVQVPSAGSFFDKDR